MMISNSMPVTIDIKPILWSISFLVKIFLQDFRRVRGEHLAELNA